MVVNQSGNESKGERGGSGGIIVMRGEAGDKDKGGCIGRVKLRGMESGQNRQKDARRRETDAVNARYPRGAS